MVSTLAVKVGSVDGEGAVKAGSYMNKSAQSGMIDDAECRRSGEKIGKLSVVEVVREWQSGRKLDVEWAIRQKFCTGKGPRSQRTT